MLSGTVGYRSEVIHSTTAGQVWGIKDMGVSKERRRDLRVQTEHVWRAVVSGMGEEDVGDQPQRSALDGRMNGDSKTQFCPCDQYT